jgi:GntR family carbon starvation induced transcriptional regulator
MAREALAEETLTDSAAERLISDIVSGTLEPGYRLRIEALRVRYGLGISPVREALIRLASQGFVTLEARRGFRVASISSDDLQDIIRARQVVEGAAIELAVERGGDEWEVGALSAMARLKLVVRRYHDNAYALIEDVEPAHRQFHTALVSACGSPRLLQFQASLYGQAERYRYIMLKKVTDLEGYIQVHETLLNVILTRDKIAARTALCEHLALTNHYLEASVTPAYPTCPDPPL